MYKNYKKDDAPTHPLTHTHTQYHNRHKCEDSWSLRGKLCCFALSRLASGSRPDWRVFPVRLSSGSNRKRSHTHGTGRSFTQFCTTRQPLRPFVPRLLGDSSRLRAHRRQSIPPMSCCLYDWETRDPDGKHRWSQTNKWDRKTMC